jgi:hypothetical protein
MMHHRLDGLEILGIKIGNALAFFNLLLGFTKIYTENLYGLPITQVRK